MIAWLVLFVCTYFQYQTQILFTKVYFIALENSSELLKVNDHGASQIHIQKFLYDFLITSLDS